MKRAILASLLLSSLWACHGAPPKPEGAAVIIKDSHIHTRYCGHYRFGDQWYFISQHRHGVDCGHELVDGEWILPQQ
jgi:hypothetical protein